jgi:hypothetical protein
VTQRLDLQAHNVTRTWYSDCACLSYRYATTPTANSGETKVPMQARDVISVIQLLVGGGEGNTSVMMSCRGLPWGSCDTWPPEVRTYGYIESVFLMLLPTLTQRIERGRGKSGVSGNSRYPPSKQYCSSSLAMNILSTFF